MQATSTTEPTTTTTDYATGVRAQYPSNESFTNKNWDVIGGDSDNHKGAAVDIVGTVIADVSQWTSIPDAAGWVNWEVHIQGGAESEGYEVLCRTDSKMDPALLKDNSIVRVLGLALGAPPEDWTSSSVYPGLGVRQQPREVISSGQSDHHHLGCAPGRAKISCRVMSIKAPTIAAMPSASPTLGGSPSWSQALITPMTGTARVASPAVPARRR